MRPSDARRRTPRTVSRRSVVRAGGGAVALAAGGLLDLSGTGRADQSDDATDRTARMYASDFYPDARFRVVSDSLDYRPETEMQAGEAFIAGLYWNDYDTRILAYENTGERALFFPPVDPGVERGAAYRTGEIRSTDEIPEGLVTVGFEPVEG